MYAERWYGFRCRYTHRFRYKDRDIDTGVDSKVRH